MVSRRIMRFEHTHGDAFAAIEIVGERLGELCDRLIERLSRETRFSGQPFYEIAVELNDVVQCSPIMTVARADLEAETAIEVRQFVQISGDRDDMINSAGHD